MNRKQIPCKLETYSNDLNSNLMKVRLMVMHDGKNFNGSSFSLPSMVGAEETIKNTPILAYTIKDDEGNAVDFDGHNMETSLVKGEDGYELKTIYQEIPIGVIPESCNPRYEIINDKNYFLVDAYIWKTYSNGSYKLIEDNEFKGASMEIRVEEGEFNFEEDVYEIRKYRYEGVTILGDNVPPAMENCRVMKYSSSVSDCKIALKDIYKEIYKIESEVHEMDENQIVEEVVEEVVEETVETVEETTVAEAFSEEVAHETEPVEESKDETVEEFEAKEEAEEQPEKEEVEEDEEFKKRKKCSLEESSLDCFNIFFEQVPATLEEVCSELIEKFNALNEELSTLREFKQNYDQNMLKDEIEEIVSEFAFNDEEVTELKEKALSGEISAQEFKKELFALEGMRVHNEKNKFSVERTIKPSVKINVVSNSKEYEPYGGLFTKFKK